MAGNKDAVEDDLSGLSAEELAALNDDDGDDTGALDEIIGDDDSDDADDPDDTTDDIDAAGDDDTGADDDGDADTDDGDGDGDDDSDDAPIAQFQPKVVSEPVENFDAKMKELADKKAELRQQLNDGDLDLEEYEAKKDDVTDEVTELRLQQRDYENDVKRRNSEGTQRWEWEQEQFFSRESNKVYGTNKLLNAALDTAVKELAGDPANANRTGSWFLEEADSQVRALMAGNPATPKPADKQKGRKPDLSNIPKTLNSLPAADNTETGGEEFAYLDKLGGVALEQELAKIARDPQKESRYLRS